MVTAHGRKKMDVSPGTGRAMTSMSRPNGKYGRLDELQPERFQAK